MVKTVRSISLELEEWQYLEQQSNLTGRSISEIISNLIQKQLKKGGDESG